MKNFKILILSLAIVVIVIFTLGLTNSFLFSGKTITETYEKTDFHTIIIDDRDADIVIRPSKDKKSRVVYTINEKEPYEIIEKDGELTFNKKGKFKILNFFHRPLSIIVEVADFKDFKANVSTQNGKIMIENIESKSIQAQTQNGAIIAKNISSEEVIFETSNGRLELSQIVSTQKIQADTQNGKVFGNDLVSKVIDLETQNGSLELNNLESKVEIKASTQNGSVDAKAIGGGQKIEMSSQNGSINLELKGNPEQYDINCSTELGKCHVDQDLNGPIKVDISTQIGSVQVSYR